MVVPILVEISKAHLPVFFKYLITFPPSFSLAAISAFAISAADISFSGVTAIFAAFNLIDESSLLSLLK